MTYNQLLQKYINYQHIVRKLIIHHSKYSQVKLLQKLDEKVDFDLKLFEKNMQRYINGEPLQYIIGHEYFLDLKIEVKPGVYIPRPETEILVDEVIEVVKEKFGDQKLVMVDVCSGSGAIALGLNFNLKQKTYGLELSLEAISQAKINNKNNNCNVEFVVSDIDQYLINNNIKVDVLVSNPPYIKPKIELENRVQGYEPHMALFDKEEDGMSFYRKILGNHKFTTKDDAIIAFELGFDQKELMEELIKDTFSSPDYYFLYDYEGHARSVIINKTK